MRKYFLISSMIALVCILMVNTNTVADDLYKAAQLAPKRLSSTGDSATEAIDAEVPGANHWASWVNGYHDFWQWLFGLTNVDSHNQRITRNFGRWGRRNYMEAKSGADSKDFEEQAKQAVNHLATYVTVFMGHNDVCRDDFEDITTESQFEENIRAGLEILRNGLPQGATIYVVGLANVSELWNALEYKKALGIVDCEALWTINPFDVLPSNCGDMLSSESGRVLMQGLIEEYNKVLEGLVEDYNAIDPNHYYFYTNAVFNQSFSESHISDIDCYHPSAAGQEQLSAITWDTGPFSGYQR